MKNFLTKRRQNKDHFDIKKNGRISKKTPVRKLNQINKHQKVEIIEDNQDNILDNEVCEKKWDWLFSAKTILKLYYNSIIPKNLPFFTKISDIKVYLWEIKLYFQLLDDPIIKYFLKADSCFKMSDKYLLAMVFAYFKRANLQTIEYNKLNFFTALYLAHTMEEDEIEYKLEIFPWLLGKNYWCKIDGFYYYYRQLFARLSYRACVSRRCCDEIIGIFPEHHLWNRERKGIHGGAILRYNKPSYESPRGPTRAPLVCTHCQPGKVKMLPFMKDYSPDFPFTKVSPPEIAASMGDSNTQDYFKSEKNSDISGGTEKSTTIYLHNSASTTDIFSPLGYVS